jgi:hypothetical protein
MGSASTALPSGAAGGGVSRLDGPMFDFSGYPLPQMPATDPIMQALMDQNNAALQQQARMDTTSILARYGSQLVAANRAAA